MPLLMHCQLCDKPYSNARIYGVCDKCVNDVNNDICTHPHTYLGCCTICGKDKESD